MKTYLVGGAVRDLLLGRHVREHDVAFEGDAACFVRQNPRARKVGRDVDVYLVDGVEHMPLRGTLDEDLAARDFTVNALAMTEAGLVHAHPQALQDLAHRVLRPASPTALADSPVRAFRAARFAAQFPDFSVHPETLDQMRAVAASGALDALPAEQVCRETLKALAAPCPGRYLKVLHAGDCLLPWFSELAGADAVPAGPARYHAGSVLDHVARVMDMAAVLAAHEADGAPPLRPEATRSAAWRWRMRWARGCPCPTGSSRRARWRPGCTCGWPAMANCGPARGWTCCWNCTCAGCCPPCGCWCWPTVPARAWTPAPIARCAGRRMRRTWRHHRPLPAAATPLRRTTRRAFPMPACPGWRRCAAAPRRNWQPCWP